MVFWLGLQQVNWRIGPTTADSAEGWKALTSRAARYNDCTFSKPVFPFKQKTTISGTNSTACGSPITDSSIFFFSFTEVVTWRHTQQTPPMWREPQEPPTFQSKIRILKPRPGDAIDAISVHVKSLQVVKPVNGTKNKHNFRKFRLSKSGSTVTLIHKWWRTYMYYV